FIDTSATFLAGSTETQEITITVNDDQLVELDEIIEIGLVAATDLGDRDIDASDLSQVEIIENDTATFSVEGIVVREGDGVVSFTVSIDNAIDIDTTLSILLSSTDDLSIVTPTITFTGGSQQSQDFSINVIDDDIEELTELVAALVTVDTELGSRIVAEPESTILTIRDNDTPDFIQAINENILTSTVPILVPTTASGGNASGGGDSGGGGGADAGSGSGSNTATQAPADSPADGSPDAAGGEGGAGNESVGAIGFVSQESGGTSSTSATQSLSSSDGSAEVEEAGSRQSKNVSSDSEFGSDAGELLFHVVLPNGKLGKKFELDIDLLNDASLFDRFRGLPTDVYRILYREPGSDSFQQLFEIYVVDGKIETILYSSDTAIEQVDPADDFDGEQPGPEPGEAEAVPVPAGMEVSREPAMPEFGRLAVPMIAASLALSRSSESWKTRNQPNGEQPMLKMDRVSRLLRRLRKS
ncbi:MAG: hypothetical protein AB8B91_21425, partial [Rubripirellula sp.]